MTPKYDLGDFTPEALRELEDVDLERELEAMERWHEENEPLVDLIVTEAQKLENLREEQARRNIEKKGAGRDAA